MCLASIKEAEPWMPQQACAVPRRGRAMDATDAVRRSAPPLSRSHLLLLLFLSCLLFMDVSSCCSAINLILIYDFFAWFCSANEHFTYVYMLSRPVPVFYSPDDLVR
jgi:hypothetical protein